MTPKWPVFIPSKGRYEQRKTIRMFQRLGVPFTVFVEPQEADDYAPYMDGGTLHVLPHSNKGLTFTRNYIWDFAEQQGFEWFWTFDDNIGFIQRFNRNRKTFCVDGTPLAVIEDFAQRYDNLAIAGMNYRTFVHRRLAYRPYTLNTRIYSNMLIRTNAKNKDGQPYRNVTFFNDDTDLCLRVLKDGWCTVLFNAFVIDKEQTMVQDGGMTTYYKETDNRKEFAEELRKAHPDCVHITNKWGRWHHHVDYAIFKQQLKRRPDVDIPLGVNNFGMVLEEHVDGEWIPSTPERFESRR